MITEVAFFDISRDDIDNDRRVVTSLYAVPAGSTVILHLGDRRYPPLELLRHVVRDYLVDLAFELQGEPHVTRKAREYVRELVGPLAS